MRRQKWWLAGILGLFAALTRSAGIFLVIPYLYELWISRDSFMDSDQSISRKLLDMLPRVLPVVLIPIGTLIYSIYCWKLFNDPIAFATVQKDWDRHLTWPWVGIWTALREIFGIQPFGSFFEVHLLLDLTPTISFILLPILECRTLRMIYNIWIALLLFYMLISPAIAQPDKLADTLVSNQRFA